MLKNIVVREACVLSQRGGTAALPSVMSSVKGTVNVIGRRAERRSGAMSRAMRRELARACYERTSGPWRRAPVVSYKDLEGWLGRGATSRGGRLGQEDVWVGLTL